ncbi:MAG TPA: DUF72 domain-containing protein [Rhizomicrobium sp.]|nr:DUF72 domain-containing protein [Rhizomicrobium sp.]
MIRVGIGGWTFEPWRDNFYPKGLAKARELQFASRAVTTIEINSTFYSSQKPESFRRWADETPDDFVFAVKASRFAVNRRVLAEAGRSVELFVAGGITELKTKLGPILWQFAPTKKYDAEDFEAFLNLLPKTHDGIALRHAIEVRHESFAAKPFVELARKFGAAIVIADAAKYPLIADVTGDFVYARLQRSEAKVETGYTTKDIAKWAKIAEAWAEGGEPKDLPRIGAAAPKKKRDVFVYVISGAKERAPAAAMALIAKLG